ncbi:hypothetical protein [Streptomyces atroolivaceus]|uniref:hypothetical protein n=1 Tax=Streptomyces atroolivaceus TaxID=66869 RepID=UPI0036C8CD42
MSVDETIKDAAGEADDKLTPDELTAFAREIAAKQSEPSPCHQYRFCASRRRGNAQGGDQLTAAYKALAQAKITLAEGEAREAADKFLPEAERLATKVAARART